MRDWNALIRAVELDSIKLCQFADNADSNFKEVVEKFNQKTFQHLLAILKLPISDAEKDAKLRFYLAMRSADVMHGAADTYLNPGLPSNQACVKVAEYILREDESLVHVLTPSVKKILGAAVPDDLKFSALDHKGTFHPGRFFLNTAGNALISPYEIFEFVWNGNLRCFPVPAAHHVDADALSRIQEKPLLSLLEADLSALATVHGEKSEVLFDAIKEKHYAQFHAKPTVANAIEDLCRALRESGKADQGSDFSANLIACERPIKTFYARWQLLDKATQSRIAACGIGNSKETVGVLLSCIFAACGIPITAEEQASLQYIVIHCVDEFSKHLMAIVNRHKALMETPLPVLHPKLPSDEVFAEQLEAFDKVLYQTEEKPIQAGHYGISRLNAFGASDIAFQIITAKYTFLKILKKFNTAQGVYLFFFSQLPSELWMLVYDNLPDDFFNDLDADIQGGVFENLSLGAKKQFITFLKQHNLLRMDGAEDFKDFFNGLSQVSIDTASELLRSDIRKALQGSENVAAILNYFSDSAWDLFRHSFPGAFEDFFKFDDDLYHRIRLLNINVQPFFLRCVMDTRGNLPETLRIDQVINIAKRLPISLIPEFLRYQSVIRVFGSARLIHQFVSSVDREVGKTFLVVKADLVKSKCVRHFDLEEYVLKPSDLRDYWFRALEDKLFSLMQPLLLKYLQLKQINTLPSQSLVRNLRCLLTEGVGHALNKTVVNKIFLTNTATSFSPHFNFFRSSRQEPTAIERRLQAELLDLDEKFQGHKIDLIHCVVSKVVAIFQFLVTPRRTDVCESSVRFDLERICNKDFMHNLLRAFSYLFPHSEHSEMLRSTIFAAEFQAASVDSDDDGVIPSPRNDAFLLRGPLLSPALPRAADAAAAAIAPDPANDGDHDDADSFVL